MPKVLIGVTGGVAAYKVCEVTSTLAKAGVEVRVIMTEQAQSFVSAVTFAALSRHPVYTDGEFWSAQQGRPLHIELGRMGRPLFDCATDGKHVRKAGSRASR